MSPWGSKPGPLNLILSDFDRAGEDAWLVGLSFDFRKVGLPGFSAFANLASGRNGHDPTLSVALPDEREIDLTFDYRVHEGRLKGFWIRVRGAFLNEHGARSESSNEVRVTLNYDLPLL